MDVETGRSSNALSTWENAEDSVQTPKKGTGYLHVVIFLTR